MQSHIQISFRQEILCGREKAVEPVSQLFSQDELIELICRDIYADAHILTDSTHSEILVLFL